MADYKMSLYRNMKEKENSEITLEDYVNKIKYGYAQDAVINARAVKQKGDLEKYKQIKSQAHVVTARGTIPSGESKTAQNIKLTGLCEIDVDEVLSDEQLTYITNDPYVLCAHKSIGGDGYVIFFKVDVNKMDNAYYAIGEYLRTQYDITADPSGKNINRLRFLSWDEDIYYNPKAKKFIVKVEKKNQLPTNLKFLHDNKSLDYIIEQIEERNIDLCQESYELYVKIGCALASEYAENGEAYFHKICSFGSKYNPKHATRDYKGFLRCTDKISIATIYWLAKQAGLELYTDKTKQLIQRVKIGKTQGTPTVESIEQNMNALGFELDDNDRETAKMLIESKEDYSSLANEGLSDIEKLANFIVDVYEPTKDDITHTYLINGKPLEDDTLNDIYLMCTKNFTDMNVKMADVISIIKSSYSKKFNTVLDFFEDNKDVKETGLIEKYVDCIESENEEQRDYKRWAFKKWMVGMIHNWLSDLSYTQRSPLTFVIVGAKQGIGKTSFFRNILPPELNKYMVAEKLNSKDKDSVFYMSSSLIVLDDEFSGMALKDVQAYKDISDKYKITQRRPFERAAKDYNRICALAGTSNLEDILRDFSGIQRRIFPINAEYIDYDTLVSIDKVALIMEAYNLYREGFEWVLSQEEIQYLHKMTSHNQFIMPLEEVFKDNFSFTNDEGYSHRIIMQQGEVLDFFLRFTQFRPNAYEIKNIFSRNAAVYKNHYCPRHRKSRKGYELFVSDNCGAELFQDKLDELNRFLGRNIADEIEEAPF